jgi:hypothetical protein
MLPCLTNQKQKRDILNVLVSPKLKKKKTLRIKD